MGCVLVPGNSSLLAIAVRVGWFARSLGAFGAGPWSRRFEASCFSAKWRQHKKTAVPLTPHLSYLAWIWVQDSLFTGWMTLGKLPNLGFLIHWMGMIMVL